MSITKRERKILWARAGNRCSYRYEDVVCDKELINTDGVIIGEECHIVGRNKSAARYTVNFKDKNKYSNLILMCPEHHKLIDDREDIYSIDVLQEMKRLHEQTVSERINRNEIQPIIIKDSHFETEVKNADEAIGMEVTKPVQFFNVKSTLRANNVRKAVGFKTNQTFNSIVMTCQSCHRNFPFACTGQIPAIIKCPICGAENKV